jgi:hypothetical protein
MGLASSSSLAADIIRSHTFERQDDSTENRLLSNDPREERLELFYGRHVASLMRKEASNKTVTDAVSLAQDERLPNFSLEFRLDDHGIYVPGR